MEFGDVIERVGKGVDAAGIGIIVIGALVATGYFLLRMRRTGEVPDAYTRYRQGIGRAILLGLELLVAADIIRTVAISPSFQSVGVLGLIVLIRTFLSLELELEIEGRWPWQRSERPAVASAAMHGDAQGRTATATPAGVRTSEQAYADGDRARRS